MNRKIQTLLALLVISGLALAACGAPAPTTEAPAQPTTAAAATEEPAAPADPFSPLNVSGDIITAGSSTVYPLSERMAERFNLEGFGDTITIDSIGSGAGYERFCVAGETDIANASRPIRESEVESCRAIDREPIQFYVGTDAVSVVVSSQNDFVTDVTAEELALIFGAANTWSDVRPEWPNEPIQRFIPGTDSGTFDFFVEIIHGTDPTAILAASNTQKSEDDNVLVQGVLGSPYAIGFFGYAYYVENAGAMNIVSINGVAPDSVSVEDGSYVLARPLFLFSDAAILAEKPQVAAFIHFYLSYVNEEIVDVGYFQASEAAIEASWDNFWAAVGQ
ncbi:MAG: PstS family phosphate ABC transporter substrate-binding protein [Anaerolineales bacterium]|nr:PstS family phosphate ABC transporter substrate-binding protein [Anaerolineales bacterium]